MVKQLTFMFYRSKIKHVALSKGVQNILTGQPKYVIIRFHETRKVLTNIFLSGIIEKSPQNEATQELLFEN